MTLVWRYQGRGENQFGTNVIQVFHAYLMCGAPRGYPTNNIRVQWVCGAIAKETHWPLLLSGTNCGKTAGVVWNCCPQGGPEGTLTVTRVSLKPPKGGLGEDAAEGLPEKNP